MQREIPCEIYSRVVGYYRPLHNWNKGKRQEYADRTEFQEKTSLENPKAKIEIETTINPIPLIGGGSTDEQMINAYKIFTFPNCSKCEEVKAFLENQPFSGTIINLKSPKGNKEFREYYSIGSIKENIKRDENGALKLPIVMFMNGNNVISTSQGVEETKSVLC